MAKGDDKMMPRLMKWHILNRFTGACAVDEEGRAIEFNTQEEALKYLDCADNPKMVEEAEIRQGILCYDGGYVDYDEEEER